MSDPVKDIFYQARDLNEPQRHVFLDEACKGDPEMRAQVERFLALEEGAGDFLKSVNVQSGRTTQQDRSSLDAAIPDEKIGSMIGPYKLVQKIGEGGFGVVYMAKQDKPVRRKVALKVVKAGMDTKAVVARFEAERQALAMMDHPHIAKVFEAGATESGRPYFVMELVKGIPITEYCDEANLDMHERLVLFKDVCAAVQHAHQKGVIHRDLKPSNIMITLHDGKPIVKVIDFGIAKATGQELTEKTLITMYGQMIGTPAYMSPEQAVMSGLDVDTRSDVYSLGVLLYELLTGGPPFDSRTLLTAGYDEMRRIIREQDPPKPSNRYSTFAHDVRLKIAAKRHTTPHALNKQIDGDLDWIVMKALEKERSRRYESASAFAQDIQHYLNAEPVQAGAPGVAYRFRRFARRNKGPVSVAAVIGLLLIGGTVTSTWLAIRATRAEHLSAKRLAQVERERQAAIAAQRAAENARANEQAANQQAGKRLAVIEASSEMISAMFEDMDIQQPVRDRNEPLGPGLADRLAVAAKQLEDDAVGEPRTVANMQYQLAKSLLSLGYPKEAVALYEKAKQTYVAAAGGGDRNTLFCTVGLGRAYVQMGDIDLATPPLEEAYKLFTANLVEADPETLDTMNDLARTYQNIGHLDRAIALFKKALALHTDESIDKKQSAFIIANNLGTAYLFAGKPTEARKLLEKTLPLMIDILSDDHPDTLICKHNLAMAYLYDGYPDRAPPLLEQVLEQSRKKHGDYHPRTFNSSIALARTYLKVGKYGPALTLFETTWKRQQIRLGDGHPDTLYTMCRLGEARLAASEPRRALEILEPCLAMMRETIAIDTPNKLECMRWLASAYTAVRRIDEALKLRQEYAERIKNMVGINPNFVKGNNKSIEQLQKLVLKEQRFRAQLAKLGPDHPDMIKETARLADAYRGNHCKGTAIELREQAVSLSEKHYGAKDLRTLGQLDVLAWEYHTGGQREKALALREDLVDRYSQALGPKNPKTINAIKNLAISYEAAGRSEEAQKLRDEVLIPKEINDSATQAEGTKDRLIRGGNCIESTRYGGGVPVAQRRMGCRSDCKL